MPIPDIELIITRAPGGAATASLRVELPNRRADLAQDVQISLNDEALRALTLIPDAYAGALTGMVFVPALREAWQRALGYAEGAGELLRVRLHLRGDDTLHALRWELLRDPLTQTPLAYRERVAFSRYLSSDHLGDVQAVTKPRLKAIVAVSGAAGPGLAPVDVAGEVERAVAALGDVPATVLDGQAGRLAASLPALADALRDGPQLLYLVCHGALVDGAPYLYIARLPGEPALPVPGTDLVRQFADLPRRPLLIVLASCRGAGDDYATLAAVGPQLARVGVGAVIAMQGEVPMTLIAALIPRLLTELRRDGQIDRALAAARAALPAEQPWWLPTLWMAAKDGVLWRTPETLPVRGAGVFQVPYPPNPLFRGRDAELARLAEALLGEQHSTAAVLPAVSGTGGIGKTQLASEFAHAHRDEFPGGVFWLNMAQPEGVASQVAAAGGPGGLDLPGWSGLGFDDKVAAVRHAWNEPVRRLLVLDNLEEPQLLQDWRPTSGGARVLLTTRRGLWAATSGVRAVPLQTLARPESIRLLLAPRYGDQVEAVLAEVAVAKEADAICEQVGDLPLALALAGAYLEQSPSLSLAGYRARLADSLLAHPSLEAELEEELPTHHAQSVAATIGLSYKRLQRGQPRTRLHRFLLWIARQTSVDKLALTLLQSAAQLAPAPIPHRLLIRLIERDPNDEDQATEVDASLHRLAAVSLVELLPEGGILIHRLVAAFVRSQDANERASAERAVAVLIDEVEMINRAGYPLQGQPYLVHLITVASRKAQVVAQQRALLQNHLGYLLQAQGDLARARPYYERALVIYEQVLGSQHPDTATSLDNLGGLLHAQGDLEGARTYVERALAIRERILGPQHIETAISLNNLGGLLHAQGDLGNARSYYKQALAICEQVLGPLHLHTARSLNNMGALLQAQGDLAGARPYYERALAINEQMLGPKHPETALSLNNLGWLLRTQGDLTEARSYYERALAITEQMLGPQHPDTARSINNMGALLEELGDFVGARSYYERALAIREQVLGLQHPDTARSFNNLGGLLGELGDFAGARPYYERALAICEQVVGPQHPDTARSLNNLGMLLEEQGDLAGARPYVERALAIREQVLGPQHPDTATTLANLGVLLEELGDFAGARPYVERALAIREQVLGPQHPDTALSLNNLGYLLQAQGDLAGAHPYYERALAICEQMLGPQHFNTARCLNNLGMLLEEQGDLAGARPYVERALAIREQVLGPQHPDTAISLNNLGGLLKAQGDLDGARPYYERALAICEQVLGPQHPDTAISLNNLGVLLQAQGDLAGARPCYERALAIWEQVLGPQHPYTQMVRSNLATLDAPRESRDEKIARLTHEAEAMFAQALAARDADQRTALADELERQARSAEEGETEGSSYLALATRLRELAAQLEGSRGI